MCRRESVVVLVLGDLGRSPRMQYHALSLANQAGKFVNFVGYSGSDLHERIESNPNIAIHRLSPFSYSLPKSLSFLFIFYAFIKLTYQACQLLCTLLFTVRPPSFILVQNPPSLPTLSVVQFVCTVRCCRLVIDWHNFGYSLLGLRLGKNHPVVKIAYWYERLCGKGAYANFCVSNSMKNFLRAEFNIEAIVLYDRSPEFFCKTSLIEQHQLFSRLQEEKSLKELSGWIPSAKNDEESTMFSKIDNNGEYEFRQDRPVLIISSTSWTPDEDFSILLDAIELLERTPKAEPNFLFLITGKGPEKEFYEQKIRSMNLIRCKVITLWLEAADYPRLLGCADLGVCLHSSSSGLDLPMKVVDMFGCSIPVCAVDFNCISELVHHDENGLLFKDSRHLASQIENLFSEFPYQTDQLDAMREKIKDFQTIRWSDSWRENALPIFS
uniref:UDP-Glycosyltransferase/glycogen phosphorylase n=1 Tax=Hirondellea gigas TaxID=1518452 RepID=A0A6A7G8H1_9CRUS